LPFRAGGVRRDADDPTSRLDVCDRETFTVGVEAGWIDGGMRVKIKTALDALEEGLDSAVVCGPDDLLKQRHATEVVRRDT